MAEQNDEQQFQAITLLRDQLLPNLLGNDIKDILYWAGKELARKSPSEDEASLFSKFEQNGFGELTFVNEKKQTREYVLSGEIIEARLNKNESVSFSLEAGFLAQQLQDIHQLFTEAIFEVKPKKKQVYLYIQTDPKEPIL
ncbi:DUF2507 domain-containing protein [Marinilactibacillus sp. Marseille-P9653]|uniref:DUF2507 domain-containing protein n=1 Tax=Marinilactibacillus sp. Marseille-P9653 TaxID=2866583 RepID=UPI001CE48F71|nr:DUF2507 domain-containing protein [Marinilactibacillus sp. Marseille-P9653]